MKGDYVPKSIAQPNLPEDYKGYFGFFLAPFDTHYSQEGEEERMCVVVGIRSTRQILAQEEAMVRGLTLTACNGISFQQFGACAQIDSVRNSADMSRHVRAKIMFIENGEGALQNFFFFFGVLLTHFFPLSACVVYSRVCNGSSFFSCFSCFLVFFCYYVSPNTHKRSTGLVKRDDVKQGGSCCSSLLANGGSRVTQLRMRMKLVTGKNHAIDSSYHGEMSKQDIAMDELQGGTGSVRFKILEWLEVQSSIKNLPQDSRAVFEILDPTCNCTLCKEEKKRTQKKEKKRKKKIAKNAKNGSSGSDHWIPAPEEHRGHIYGWASCSLFDYAKCYGASLFTIFFVFGYK